MKKIGILSGTFDPVHKGHISFALQAIEAAGLDEVVFVPEPLPRHKQDVTHIGHRIAMLELIVSDYPNLSVLELPDKQFTVAASLPRLIKKYPNDELFMLIGTDVLAHISVWPHVKTLLRKVSLVVAVRGQKDMSHAKQLLTQLPLQPSESHVLVSNHRSIAGRDIRATLKAGEVPVGMFNDVASYAKQNWLYESLLGSANKS